MTQRKKQAKTWEQNNTGKLKNGHLADWLGLYLSLFLLENWATVWKMGDKIEEITELSGNEGRLSSWQKDSFHLLLLITQMWTNWQRTERQQSRQTSALGAALRASSPFVSVWYDGCHGEEGRKTSSKVSLAELRIKWCLTSPDLIRGHVGSPAAFLQPAPTVRAEKGGPGDRLVMIVHITILDLSLSPSLFRPSCRKLYRNQDEALFQMCVMVSLGSDSTEKLHTQRSAVQKEPEYWTKVALFCIDRTGVSSYLRKTHTHSDLQHTQQTCVH